MEFLLPSIGKSDKAVTILLRFWIVDFVMSCPEFVIKLQIVLCGEGKIQKIHRSIEHETSDCQ